MMNPMRLTVEAQRDSGEEMATELPTGVLVVHCTASALWTLLTRLTTLSWNRAHAEEKGPVDCKVPSVG
jgi:hypothetical protein